MGAPSCQNSPSRSMRMPDWRRRSIMSAGRVMARRPGRRSGGADLLGQDRHAILAPQFFLLQSRALELLVRGEREVTLQVLQSLLDLGMSHFQAKDFGLY